MGPLQRIGGHLEREAFVNIAEMVPMTKEDRNAFAGYLPASRR